MTRDLIALAAFLVLVAFSSSMILLLGRSDERRSIQQALKTALTDADAQYVLETERIDRLDAPTIARLARRVDRMRALPTELQGSAELWIEAALVRDEVRRMRNMAIGAVVLAGVSATLAALTAIGVFPLAS